MRWFLLCLLACSACGGEDEDGDENDEDCITQFSEENGGSFESDASRCTDDQCEPANVQAVCEADGEGEFCDASAFITREAALCVAKENGLSEEVAQALEHLVHNYRYHAPIWAVAEVREQDATSRRGRTFEVHATTGELLEILGWRETSR